MRLIASFLIIFIATEITVAQSNTSSVFRFLEITPTARSAGMGVITLGNNGDLSLMHINPAFPFQLMLTFKQLNSWDLLTFEESEKPEIFDNLIRHVLFGGEAKIAEVVHLRIGYDHYLHEQTKTGRNFDLAGVAFGFEVRNITFDFNRNSYSKLGGSTRLSIKTNLL